MTTTTCAYPEPVTFAIATDAAFNQIRQYSTSDVAVTIRLLEAIAVIATYTRNNKDRARAATSCRHDQARQSRGVSEELDRRCGGTTKQQVRALQQ